jgi:hypothetical protein
MGWHPTKLYSIEAGKVTIKAAEVDGLLGFYGVGETRAEQVREIASHARRRIRYGKIPDWNRQYVGLEQDATLIKVYEGELVPGIGQIEPYAKALISTSVTVARADVEPVVAARMRRRSVLERPNPPQVHLVLGEAAIRRTVGGRETLKDQVEHLIALAELDNFTIQIMPFSAGEHAALGVGFTLLTVPIGDEDTQWVYLESLTRADCVPEPSTVQPYELTFQSLVVNALGERETLALLREVRDTL